MKTATKSGFFNIFVGLFTVLFLSVVLLSGIAWSLSNIASVGTSVIPFVKPTPFVPNLISEVNLTSHPTPSPLIPSPVTKPSTRKHDDVEGNAAIMPPGSCNTSIGFRIGSIDDRFGLSRNSVEIFAKQAADIWNNAINKPVFQSDPYGSITINLVYDERQPVIEKLNLLEQQLSRDASTISSIKTQFETLKTQYDQKLNEYNSSNNPTEEQYNELKAMQANLEALVVTINADVNAYNDLVNTYNSTSQELESLFDQTPYAGIYNTGSRVITIYINRTQEEFTHTIAHELGHAIGLGHSENSSSIMYPDTSAAITLSPEDLTAIKTRCSL